MFLKRRFFTIFTVLAIAGGHVSTPAFAQSEYFPPPGEWERRSPEQMGIDADGLQAAVEFAVSSENTSPLSPPLSGLE